MCEDITLNIESGAGLLIELCDNFPAHLGPGFLDLRRSHRGPFQPLLAAFAPATFAVVEFPYFDLDYRSEFSATHETSFAVRDPDVQRLHLFRHPIEDPHLREAVEGAAAGYVGYVIIRPQEPGAIGRSIVPPSGSVATFSVPSADDPAESEELQTAAHYLKAGERLETHVRTAVTEHVSLFGVPLQAVGVPFMEQDGHLLRCIHVSAWICHFSAALRGVVPRRASAEFHLAVDPTGSYGRPYPSEGLSTFAMATILRELDLPPEVVDDTVLLSLREEPAWYDRSELRDASATLADDSPELERVWVAENVTATVCRYLNSGIPCILSQDDDRHTYVICGYLRQEDLTPTEDRVTTEVDLHSDVVAFLVMDDQDGPYRLYTVESIVSDLLDPDDDQGVTILVPLPRGLWLSGTDAEVLGAEILAAAVRQRLEHFDSWAEHSELDGEARAEHHNALRDLHESLRDDPSQANFAIRSYATNGSDFKSGFTSRINDAGAARTVGYTSLPKYVWVVEAIDRRLRAQPGANPHVRATVVLDASAVPALGDARFSSGLLIHLPGQLSRVTAAGEDIFADEAWTATGIEPYFSGRWHHDRDWINAPASVASRAKTATVARR